MSDRIESATVNPTKEPCAMTTPTTTWEEWKAQFAKEWAEYAGQDIAERQGWDWDLWRHYFEEGVSPWDAIVDDATT
jgi:hypothetical protein